MAEFGREPLRNLYLFGGHRTNLVVALTIAATDRERVPGEGVHTAVGGAS